MIAKNDTDTPRKWVNGTIGIIQSLSKNQIQVLVKGKTLIIGKAKWDEYKYEFKGMAW